MKGGGEVQAGKVRSGATVYQRLIQRHLRLCCLQMTAMMIDVALKVPKKLVIQRLVTYFFKMRSLVITMFKSAPFVSHRATTV